MSAASIAANNAIMTANNAIAASRSSNYDGMISIQDALNGCAAYSDRIPWYVEWILIAGLVGVVAIIFALLIWLVRDAFF